MSKEKSEDAKATSQVRRLTNISRLRLVVQFASFILLNAVVFGLGPWPLLLPVLGTLGVPIKTVGEALGSLQWMLYQLIFPWLALASIFLVAALLGRALCAWVCPFGFVQDLLRYVKRRHMQVSLRTHEWMINIKYAILAIILFISGTIFVALAMGIGQGYKASLGVFGPAPFNALSPADTLFAIVPRLVLNIRYTIPLLPEKSGEIAGMILSVSLLLWARLIIMGIIIVAAVQVPRSWCRYLCPQGAFMALLYRFSFLGLKRNPLKCTKASCRACVEVCPMKVPILDLPWEKFTHPECIYCLKCVEACSTEAIRPKFP